MKFKVFTMVTCGILALSAFAGCSPDKKEASLFSSVTITQTNGNNSFVPTISGSPSEKIEIPLLSGDIFTVCNDYYVAITDNFNKDNTDVFAPTPLTISWNCDEKPEYYTLNLSTNADMSSPQSFVTFDNSVTLDYLFMGYDYYYQIIAKYSDKIVKSRIFEFSTSYLPRTVFVDANVSNTRDWGGYVTADGNRVKQGIVYRGGKLETITDSGKDVMLNKLGIKTDLDVRGDGTAGTSISPLGEEVNYIETKGPYYVGANGIDQAGAYREALVTEIKAFANRDNFPIYVHCSLGRDRTGTICFLINALLGVGETDLFRDYEISMMSLMGRVDGQNAQNMVVSEFTGLYNYIKNLIPGKTLAQNTETFMISIGVSKSEIASIKANMLEGV